MKKKKSVKKWVILGIVLVVVVLAVLGFLKMRADIAESAKTTYEIVDVKKGTIEVRVKGAGAVEPLVDETTYASFTGSVAEVFAEDGDIVSTGDVIAVFESEQMDAQRDEIEEQIDEIDAAIGVLRSVQGSDKVCSPVEGTVKLLYAEVGDSVDVVVDTYGALAVISPDDLMQVTLPVSDNAMLGDTVTVTVGDSSTEGEVYAIDTDASQMTVRFEDEGYTVGDTVIVTAEDGGALGDAPAEIANPVYITAKGGEIEKVYEDQGDEVKRGGSLLRLDGTILSADLYAQIEQRRELENDLIDLEADMEALKVEAETDGVISGLDLSPDQIVQEGTKLFTIESNETIKMDVEIDELDIAEIELGQKAEVSFDALPDKMYTATVIKINPIGVAVNNVTSFTITLEIEQDGQILLGMSADVEIVSQRAQGVLMIPQEAIQIVDGEKYVVFEEDIDESLMYTPATHEIETGITDGVMIEVTSGLKQGDRVAVPQAKSLTSQQMQQKMMFGGSKKTSDSK